jgi:hypothetical protein
MSLESEIVMYEAMANIAKISGNNIKTPHLVAIGDQDTGKTTTINRFLGVQFLPARVKGDSSEKAKTLCPIYINGFPDKSDGKYRVAVSCHGIDRQEVVIDNRCDIPRVCGEHLQRLNGGLGNGNITGKAIYIDLRGPDVRPIHIVDLPGVRSDTLRGDIVQIINDHLNQYPDTICMFFVKGADTIVSSGAWSIASKQPNKQNSILVIVRPESIGVNDDKIMNNIAYPNKDVGMPLGNIVVIKNPDTGIDENPDPEFADELESSYFSNHPMYRAFTTNPIIGKRIGFPNLLKLVSEKVCKQFRGQMGEIKASLSNLLRENTKLLTAISEPITDANRNKLCIVLMQNAITKIGRILRYEEKTAITGHTFILKMDEEFANELKKIDIGNIDRLVSMFNKSGGTVQNGIGGNDNIWLDEVYSLNHTSPLGMVQALIHKYLDIIDDLFREMIQSLDMSEYNVDPMFWEELKQKLIGVIDKDRVSKYLADSLSLLRHIYDHPSVPNFSASQDTLAIGLNMPQNKIKSQYIKANWEQSKDTVKRLFPRAVQELFIIRNVKEFDDVCFSWYADLLRFVNEAPEMRDRRELLEADCLNAKRALESLSKF